MRQTRFHENHGACVELPFPLVTCFVKQAVVAFMKHEIGIAPLRKGLFWALGIAAIFTLIDYLDDETSDFEAVVYYPSTFACATLSLYLTALFLRRRPRFRVFSVAREAWTVLIACLPTAIVVLFLDLYVNPDLGEEIAEAPDERGELMVASFIESYLESIFYLAVVWFFLSNAGRRGEPSLEGNAERQELHRRPSEGEVGSENASLGLPTELPSDESNLEKPADSNLGVVSEIALIERFPRLQGHRIRALEAQEHYVKVYSDLGEELVLYRFADAVQDVEGLDGLRVHRSFWVACDAVVSAKRDGRKVKLVLQDGLEVPVSKTYRPAAEAAGLIRF